MKDPYILLLLPWQNNRCSHYLYLQVMQTSSGPSIVLQGLHGYSLTPQQLALVQHQVKQQLLKGKLVHTVTLLTPKLRSCPSIHWLHLYSSRVYRQTGYAGSQEDVPGRATGAHRAAAAHSGSAASSARYTVATATGGANASGNLLLLDDTLGSNISHFLLIRVHCVMNRLPYNLL